MFQWMAPLCAFLPNASRERTRNSDFKQIKEPTCNCNNKKWILNQGWVLIYFLRVISICGSYWNLFVFCLCMCKLFCAFFHSCVYLLWVRFYYRLWTFKSDCRNNVALFYYLICKGIFLPLPVCVFNRFVKLFVFISNLL